MAGTRTYLEDGSNNPVAVVTQGGREVKPAENPIPPMPLESDQRTYLEATDKPNSAVAVTFSPNGGVSEKTITVFGEQGNRYVALIEEPNGRTTTVEAKVYSEGNTRVAITQDADGKTHVAEAPTGMEAALKAVAGMKLPEGVTVSEGSAPPSVPNGKSGGIER